jgi:lambda family phage tail tape measure protein
MGNETKIIITALTAQAEGALRSLSGSLDNTTRKMFDMSGVAAALTGALSITAFAGWIKGSIDAADELSKLAQKTGTSVEALAGLKFAADQNGTSLDAVARAGQKLATMMADKPKIFKDLGISATDSTGAMVQMADIFAAMPDGVGKTALATKLFGDRLSAEMIPFLNQGSTSLRDYIEEGKRFNPVTAESARQSELFSDQLDALKAQAGGLGVTIANESLPALTQITSAMAEAAKEGGLLRAVVVGIGGAMKWAFTDDLMSREQKIIKDMAAAKMMVDSSLPEHIKAQHREKMLALQQELDGIQKTSAAEKAKHADLVRFREEMAAMRIAVPQAAVYEMARNGASEKEINEAQARVNKLKHLAGLTVDDKKTAKSKTDPNIASVTALQNDMFRQQMELLGVTSEQVKVYELSMKGATRAQIDQAQAAADFIGVINDKLDAEKQAKKQAEDFAKGGAVVAGLGIDYGADMAGKNRTLNDAMLSASDKQHADNLDAVAQRAARAREELAKLNITDEARLALLASVNQADADQKQKMEELRQQIELNNASWEYGARVALRGYLDEISNVAKQSESLMTKAFKGMEDALVSFVRTGKLDFKSLADSIISDLIRMQIQQSIMKPIAGAMDSAGGIGGLLSSIFGGGTSSAPASVGATASTWTSTSMPLIPSFEGGGFTGMGARSGGLDGRGGFLSLLHPQEDVIDRTRGNGGSSAAQVTLQVNIVNNASQQVSATAQQNSSGGFDMIIEQIEGGIARNVQRGEGALSNVMTQTFGLNRAPGALR